MKSLIKNIYHISDKYWNGIQLSVLIAIFGNLFFENFILSNSWEVLSLRSIDDYAMQDSIRSMQKLLVSGDWKRVFGFFDYAYGNAFWLINAVFLLPLYYINDAQFLIVAGREISLFFVFWSIYLIGLIIDLIYPNARQLKYPVLIAIATMPMVTIISTKLHVNAQYMFLGILSFYLLIRDPILNRRSLVWSGFFAGMAVGFKLTGVIIIPLLGLTLLNRLWQQANAHIIKDTMIFFMIFVLTSVACTAPAMLLFPFYTDELNSTYKVFLLFKNMGSGDTPGGTSFIAETFWYYLSPISLLSVLLLFVVLIAHDLKRKTYISLYIFGVIVTSVILIITVAHKGPLYIATYILSIAFFLPFGLLGISDIKISNLAKIVMAYCVVIAGFIYGGEHRAAILTSYNFSKMIENENTQRQLRALEEIRHLVYPLKLPIRFLQDSTAIFPATRFIDGVDGAINYGDLKEKSTWGAFDYILLNSKDYYGKRMTSTVRNQKLPFSQLSGADLEETTRELLHDTGMYYGRKYRLIYDGYDSLLYKLVSE